MLRFSDFLKNTMILVQVRGPRSDPNSFFHPIQLKNLNGIHFFSLLEPTLRAVPIAGLFALNFPKKIDQFFFLQIFSPQILEC